MIRILHPSIDDYQNTVVIRGVLDNDSLSELRTDFYQRELLPSTSRKNIRAAIEAGSRLPDVVLGMRGDDFNMEKNCLTISDPVFIIDGQQRIRTVMEMLGTETKKNPRLGTIIHVNTCIDFERDLFQKLNQFQVKVSPNILLRNTREDHPLIATLYGLTNSEKTFCLYDRVSWSQNMRRSDLISASTFLNVILTLHSHIGSGIGRNHSLSVTIPNSDKLIDRIGLPASRNNIKTFFEAINSMWGISRISIKGGAPYMRRGFLEVFAKILSDHHDFWKGDREQRLEIPYPLKKKLSSVPFDDPEIHRLASATGAAKLTLYIHIVNHINSGKRTKRITSRKPSITFNIEESDEDEALAI